jgi:DNA-binding MarR family transcriptional regulator
MESTRENLRLFVRRFGLLNASCCDFCCGEQVSLVQCHILHEIRRAGNASIQRVADELGMDITTFSRQIKTLEKKGMILRRISPDDRRVSLLGLTDSGMDVTEKIDRFMTEKVEQIFSCMTPFERETVTKSLELLNGALANIDKSADERLDVEFCK